jgi:hypothetical protein
MFNGHVAMLNPCGVEWDHNNDPLPDEISQVFPEIWNVLKVSFSKNAPAEIKYIVMVSYIEDVGFHWHNNEQMLVMPVQGYVVTSKCMNRKEWENSIQWCDTMI